MLVSEHSLIHNKYTTRLQVQNQRGRITRVRVNVQTSKQATCQRNQTLQGGERTGESVMMMVTTKKLIWYVCFFLFACFCVSFIINYSFACLLASTLYYILTLLHT